MKHFLLLIAIRFSSPSAFCRPLSTQHRDGGCRWHTKQEEGGAGSVTRLVVLISTVPAARTCEQTAADVRHTADCRRACLVSPRHGNRRAACSASRLESAHTLSALW
jgi:hypothetical protein